MLALETLPFLLEPIGRGAGGGRRVSCLAPMSLRTSCSSSKRACSRDIDGDLVLLRGLAASKGACIVARGDFICRMSCQCSFVLSLIFRFDEKKAGVADVTLGQRSHSLCSRLANHTAQILEDCDNGQARLCQLALSFTRSRVQCRPKYERISPPQRHPDIALGVAFA